MQAVNATSLQAPAVDTGKTQSPADLGSSDFFQLLITQILNQDPLQPTSNEDLLKQIASIREIELSSTLTESLQKLTGQQHLSAASSMIGQFVTSVPKGDGTVDRGLVTAVRFADGGTPVLQLSTGAEVSLDQVGLLQSPQQAAESFVGQSVMGIDQRDRNAPQVVDAIVTGVRNNEAGEILLELDSGSDIRLRDVVNARGAEAVAT